MAPDYAAPAARLFTVAHIRDPEARAQDDASGRPATCGRTRCGLDMVLADLWQLISLEPGDAVCPWCLSGETLTEEQGALI